MKDLSRCSQVLMETFQKGYRVNEEGDVISPKGLKPKLRVDTRGYLCCTVSTNHINGYQERYPLLVHRLVAYQKYGDKLFQAGLEVRHKDGEKLNNSFDNILIGTHTQNMMDIPSDQRLKRSLHAALCHRKYPHEEVILEYERTGSYKKTMKRFGITSKGTLHNILNGR